MPPGGSSRKPRTSRATIDENAVSIPEKDKIQDTRIKTAIAQ